METIKFVSVGGLPKGNRLAVFTCSGGDGLMTADIAEAIDLPLPQHSPAQVAELRTQLPELRHDLQPAGLQHVALGS